MARETFEQFISRRLMVAAVPGVPEVVIHTAHAGSGLARFALDNPYFAYPWAGGIALSRYVFDNPGLVAGRRVLDLGAGSGLVGIAAALAGAKVLAADADPAALSAVRLNAAANGVNIDVVAGDPLASDPPDVDIVLAGDVFYAPEVGGRMLDWLNRCSARSIAVLVGDPGRTDLPVSSLRRVAAYTVTDFGGTRVEAGIYALADSRPAPAALAPDGECPEKEPASHTGPAC